MIVRAATSKGTNARKTQYTTDKRRLWLTMCPRKARAVADINDTAKSDRLMSLFHYVIKRKPKWAKPLQRKIRNE